MGHRIFGISCRRNYTCPVSDCGYCCVAENYPESIDQDFNSDYADPGFVVILADC